MAEMTQTDLIKECFNYLNAYKRHRALEQIRREERKFEQADQHQLEQYKIIDKLELGMRAMQKEIRWQDSRDTEEILGSKLTVVGSGGANNE